MRKLKRLRAERGLTMDVLEERTGVSKRTISEIERGMRVPQVLTLAKLAGALGVDIDELLEEEAPRVPASSPSTAQGRRSPKPVTKVLPPLEAQVALGEVEVQISRILKAVAAGKITPEDGAAKVLEVVAA